MVGRDVEVLFRTGTATISREGAIFEMLTPGAPTALTCSSPMSEASRQPASSRAKRILDALDRARHKAVQ